MQIDCVLKTGSILGESPLWSTQDHLLYWVDILGKIVHIFDPLTRKHQTKHLPDLVTSVSLRKKGGLILTLKKRVVAFDPLTSQFDVIAEVEKELSENRFNDSKCDRFGRLWIGTINQVHWNNPDGTLYCLHPNGNIIPIEGKGICFNGIGWSPDNQTMYVTQSLRYCIFAYDFDPVHATLSRKRVFATLPEGLGGCPDGLTVDSEGYVWSAHTGLGQVVRYHPNGQVEQIIEFPVPRVSSCMFGGKDLQTLYVTSAQEKMSPEEIAKYPLSGSLFACKLPIKGLPEPCFGDGEQP